MCLFVHVRECQFSTHQHATVGLLYSNIGENTVMKKIHHRYKTVVVSVTTETETESDKNIFFKWCCEWCVPAHGNTSPLNWTKRWKYNRVPRENHFRQCECFYMTAAVASLHLTFLDCLSFTLKTESFPHPHNKNLYNSWPFPSRSQAMLWYRSFSPTHPPNVTLLPYYAIFPTRWFNN